MTPADMLGIQLDDRALFLSRWRTLLLGVLDPETVLEHPGRAEFRRLVEDWDARAGRSEEHTSELQSRVELVCRLLLEKKKRYPRHLREHAHRTDAAEHLAAAV